MLDDGGVVRRIAWSEVCPWLLIFRVFRLSISLPVLFLATVATLWTPVGWQLAENLFLDSSDFALAHWNQDRIVESIPDTSWAQQARHALAANPVAQVYRTFSDPVYSVFRRNTSIAATAYHVFCLLWNVLVWSFFAGAITRIAAMQLGRRERVELRAAVRFAAAHYLWNVTAPLFPLFGVCLAATPIAVLGLLMRMDVGVFLTALAWPFALLGGLAMTVLLIGLSAGWPMMWPTISSEEHGDAFEAFQRTYSYVFRHPLQYLGYVVVVLLFGAVSWQLVSIASEMVIGLPQFAAAWGASQARWDWLIAGETSGAAWAGAELIQVCESFVRLLARAFQFSFFFCAATALYLVMRRDVDQVALDDIFVADDPAAMLPDKSPPTRTEDNSAVVAPCSAQHEADAP